MIMKRGSILIASILLLIGIIILFFGLYGLGINGYAVYDGKFDNLAMQKGITGNTVFSDLGDWVKRLIGGEALSSPQINGNSYFDDFTSNITDDVNSGINQSSIVNVVWDGVSAYYPLLQSGGEIIADASTLLLMHMNGNANDSSGRGNNGAITGNVNCSVNGKFNQACGFDGAGDYIQISGTSDILENKNAFTISAWIYGNTADPTAGYHYILSQTCLIML